MKTNKRSTLMALLVMTLFTTGGTCSLEVRHGGIMEILDNVLYGRPPLENVTTGENSDLFGGDLSCATDCFVNADSCGDCGDCSDCGDCGNCSDCSNCSDCDSCACTIQPINFAVQHPNQRIPNAAQVRLTSNGLDFLEGTLTDLVAGVLPPLD